MMAHLKAGVLILLMLYASVSSISNLTSQQWIDFVSEQPDGLQKYSECLARHLCDSTSQESIAALDFMRNITGRDGISLHTVASVNRQCSCDARICIRHGSCCQDVTESSQRPAVSTSCITQHNIDILFPFYSNNKCPEGFENLEIRKLCDTPITSNRNNTDLTHWIVSSNLTVYTYRNVYCALCNGESMNNLVFWDVLFYCPEQMPTIQLAGSGQVLDEIHRSCEVLFSSNEFAEGCVQAGVVSTCPEDTTIVATVKADCELGETAMVYDEPSRRYFKNIYCAHCNEARYSDVSCDVPRVAVSFLISRQFQVDPFGASCEEKQYYQKITESSECNSISERFASCGEREIYNWVNQTCQKICPEPLHWVNDQCQISRPTLAAVTNETTDRKINCVEVTHEIFIVAHQQHPNSRIKYEDTSVELIIDNKTAYCTRCNWISYDNGDVTISNKTFILTAPTGETYSQLLYAETIDSATRVCAKTTTEPLGLLKEICVSVKGKTVSVTTMSISIVCLIITLIVYIILPKLHNVPGYIVMSQMVPLTFGYIFFLLPFVVESSAIGCYILSVLAHYAMLSSLTWGFLFAVEITITVNSLYTVNQKSTKKFVKYSIFGWSVPLIFVIAALIVDQMDIEPDFSPQYGKPKCWFNSAYGMEIYLMIPAAVALSLNIVFYIIIITRFAMLAYQTRSLGTSHSQKIILSIKLIFAFGILWAFGILSVFISNNSELSCIFFFINSLEGAFLMLIFICNGSVLNGLKQLAQECLKRQKARINSSSNRKAQVSKTTVNSSSSVNSGVSAKSSLESSRL